MLGGVTCLVLALTAPADARAVGVLPVKVKGSLTRAQRKTVVATVTDALAQSATVIPPAELTRAHRKAKSCADAECWQAAAEAVEVRYLVGLQIDKSGPDYELWLRLIDGESGEVLTSADRQCEICGFAEVTQTLGEMSSALARRIDEAAVTGRLVVNTAPEGAQVRLDRKLVGTTPLDLPVAPGRRSLRIRHKGYIARAQPILMVAGTTSRVDADLEPVPPSRYRGWGWATLAAGVAGVGVGATLLALEGRPVRSRCTGDDLDADGDCRFRYGTLTGGVVSMVTGGVLLGAATALLVVGYRARRGPKTRARISPRGMGVEGRF